MWILSTCFIWIWKMKDNLNFFLLKYSILAPAFHRMNAYIDIGIDIYTLCLESDVCHLITESFSQIGLSIRLQTIFHFSYLCIPYADITPGGNTFTHFCLWTIFHFRALFKCHQFQEKVSVLTNEDKLYPLSVSCAWFVSLLGHVWFVKYNHLFLQ